MNKKQLRRLKQYEQVQRRNVNLMHMKMTELERTQGLFAFLQGQIPEGCRYKRSHQPKLTADQAWTVIWWLGNEYWQVKDYIERCGVCGELYDSRREGYCLDYGKAPYHFCESCRDGEEYQKKMRRNPDKDIPKV